MKGPADRGGHRLGGRTGTPDPRSRCHLRRRIRRPRGQPRHAPVADGATVALAERVRRAMGRHTAPRTAGSRDRAWRTVAAPPGPAARRLLQRGPAPYVAGRAMHRPGALSNHRVTGTSSHFRVSAACTTGTRGQLNRPEPVFRHHNHRRMVSGVASDAASSLRPSGFPFSGSNRRSASAKRRRLGPSRQNHPDGVSKKPRVAPWYVPYPTIWPVLFTAVATVRSHP
jgi:hypothetical protein